MANVTKLIISTVIVFAMIVGQISCNHSNLSLYGESSFQASEVDLLDTALDIELAPNNKLKFNLSFNMPRSSLILRLPNTFLHLDQLYKLVENLTTSSNATLRNHPNLPYLKVLSGGINERISISYLFRANNSQQHYRIEDFSAPIIRKNYFQFVGLMALIFPVALLNSPKFSLDINWIMPNNFSLFNSFGLGKKSQKVTIDFDELRDALFIGGSELRGNISYVNKQPIYTILNGNFSQISDQELTYNVTKLIKTQRDTFDDNNFPYFLIHFLSVQSNCINGSVKFSGTAHQNSFRAFLPSGCRLLPEMKQLISHELVHTWIGKKIKLGKERGHIDGKWFTEGFTDYYGRLLAYRAGVLSEREYFYTLNSHLEKYYLSAEINTTLNSLIKRMYRRGYTSRALEDIPYQQGEIVALRLNSNIKKISNFKYSLDDAIKDMLNISKNSGGNKNFTINEITHIFDRYAPGALTKDFGKINNGEILLPPTLKHCRLVYKKYRNTFKFKKIVAFYGPKINKCNKWLK